MQGRRVAGTQAQRRSGCLGGAVIVAQRGQGGGEVGVGGGIVGAQANGGAQRGRGVRRAPQTKQDDAEAAVKRRGARGDHDRLADQIRGCLGIAALVRQKAQFMQRVGVMGRLPKDGAAAGNGRRFRAGDWASMAAAMSAPVSVMGSAWGALGTFEAALPIKTTIAADEPPGPAAMLAASHRNKAMIRRATTWPTPRLSGRSAIYIEKLHQGFGRSHPPGTARN